MTTEKAKEVLEITEDIETMKAQKLKQNWLKAVEVIDVN